MLKRLIISILICILAIFQVAVPALAQYQHEDPVTADSIYSGVALLQYYSDALDQVLQRNAEGTQHLLIKAPFTNIPPQLQSPVQNFASNGIFLSRSLSDLFKLWEQEYVLVGQYRLDEAAQIQRQIAESLPLSSTQLSQIQASAISTGTYLNPKSPSSGNQLKLIYGDVLSKIQRLSDMLDLLERPIIYLIDPDKTSKPSQIGASTSSGPSTLFGHPFINLTNINKIIGSSQITTLTLNIFSTSAFVGDSVEFSGRLSSNGETLAGKKIDILLNKSTYITAVTDAQGVFQGELQIPFWYFPKLAIQAIYYPQGDDIGLYLGSASPTVDLTVLYYSTDLSVRADNPAHPGQEASVYGVFDYGQSPSVNRDEAELYLDDTYFGSFNLSPNFTLRLSLSPGVTPGQHIIVISVPANGRYAGVNASCTLTVTRAAVILDLNTPGFTLIPGSFGLVGNLHSSVGPVQNANVTFEVGSDRLETLTALDGSFKAEFRMAPDFSLLGSQTITIRVQPQEPWNAPITTTRSVFMINVINCGILIVILIYLSFYLPRRVKNWLGSNTRHTDSIVEAVIPIQEPFSEGNSLIDKSTDIPDENNKSVPDSLFIWYRFVLKGVQSITRVLLQPQQTLREYARENFLRLGSAGRYFYEFTLLIERALYSHHRPTVEDLEKGRQLSHQIHKEAK
jgi:hypothetical protein